VKEGDGGAPCVVAYDSKTFRLDGLEMPVIGVGSITPDRGGVREYWRPRLKCDGTGAETRFRLSTKRMSTFNSAGASVQSTTGSRGVRISMDTPCSEVV
jgi:hypothetical protein